MGCLILTVLMVFSVPCDARQSHATAPVLKTPSHTANHNNGFKRALGLTAEEKTWLKEHPYIRIGLPQGLIPYVMEDHQGNQDGILVDFLHEFNQVLGTHIVLKTTPSSRIYEMTANRDINVIYAVEMLAGLPPELLQELHKATLALDGEAIFAVIERIEPLAQDTAKGLQTLMDNFQIGLIQELLREE